jgi:hypothetical protein
MIKNMPRREFLSKAALSAAALRGAMSPLAVSSADKVAAGPSDPKDAMTAREYLKGLLYTREEVKLWLAGKAFPFAKYSNEFGWLLRDARFQDGIDDAINIYTYGPLDERITIHYKNQPCRINAYGNSYTQCHQVSDGETWPEVLAAHLQEPVRNFGVGGWSVYQAYLRLLKEEQRVPADLIVFNIYQDDHFRNLDSWRNIRVRKHERFIEPTLPYVEVDVEEDRFLEKPNPCPTPESVYNLCDLDWVIDRFRNDFALNIMLAHENAQARNPAQEYTKTMDLATTHGIITRVDTGKALSPAADALHQRAAYYSSRQIIKKVEAFAHKHKKKVLYILSYPAQYIARYVKEGVRPDQPFVAFMQQNDLPVVDLLQLHVDESRQYQGELKDYLKQYFVGHYNPRGNFFTAFAIKDRIVQMLNPKPRPYRPESGIMRM